MSCVLSSNIPNISQALISIWFRIPQASFEQAIGNSATIDEIIGPGGGALPSSYFWGAVPIITFGPANQASTGPINVGQKIKLKLDRRVLESGDGRGSGFGLALHLQFDDKGSVTGGDPDLTNDGFNEYTAFGITWDGDSFIAYPTPIPISADEWHHLLISWDLTGTVATTALGGESPSDPGVNIDSGVKIYVALDDENISGEEQLGIYGGYAGGNTFITEHAWTVLNNDSTDPFPTFSWKASALPTGPALGLPTAGLSDINLHCELAEFQMFVGDYRDTGNLILRRAFISAEGKPVPAEQKAKRSDDSTGYSGSIEYMGRRPDIMLHGQGNWINGKNTGSLGQDADGNEIPAGQFTPSGEIKKYSKNPKLGA